MNAEQMKRRDDIHTCHDQCERIACVQRREIDELKLKIAVAKKALEFYADRWTYYKRLKDGSREEDYYKFERNDVDYEKIIEDWNGETLIYNFSSPGKKAREALKEIE